MKTVLTIVTTLVIALSVLLLVGRVAGVGKLLAICEVKNSSNIEDIFQPENIINCKYVTWLP